MILDLHIEIESFWKKAGYQIEVRHYMDGSKYRSSFSIKNIGIIAFLAEPTDQELTYSFQGSLYSEQDMLRIVRLKAFL